MKLPLRQREEVTKVQKVQAMDSQVKQALESGFVLYFPPRRSGRWEEIAAVAVCRNGCDKKRCGIFLLPHQATFADEIVRKALLHEQKCSVAQQLKSQRRHITYSERKRAGTQAASCTSDESLPNLSFVPAKAHKPVTMKQWTRQGKHFQPFPFFRVTTDPTLDPKAVENERAYMHHLLRQYGPSIAAYDIKVHGNKVTMQFQFREGQKANAEKCSNEFLAAHKTDNTLNAQTRQMVQREVRGSERWAQWRKRRRSS